MTGDVGVPGRKKQSSIGKGTFLNLQGDREGYPTQELSDILLRSLVRVGPGRETELRPHL